MCGQMIAAREVRVAHRAPVRTYARVQAQVSIQHVASGKRERRRGDRRRGGNSPREALRADLARVVARLARPVAVVVERAVVEYAEFIILTRALQMCSVVS